MLTTSCVRKAGSVAGFGSYSPCCPKSSPATDEITRQMAMIGVVTYASVSGRTMGNRLLCGASGRNRPLAEAQRQGDNCQADQHEKRPEPSRQRNPKRRRDALQIAVTIHYHCRPQTDQMQPDIQADYRCLDQLENDDRQTDGDSRQHRQPSLHQEQARGQQRASAYQHPEGQRRDGVVGEWRTGQQILRL